MKHEPSCVIFVCTCGSSKEESEVSHQSDKFFETLDEVDSLIEEGEDV